MLKIVHISDTHEKHDFVKLPAGDLLIHSGDFSNIGNKASVLKFINWMSSQDFKFKCCIAGNHDLSLESTHKDRKAIIKAFKNAGIHYLQDSSVVIEGNLIYGSAWTPEFCNWGFNLPRGAALKAKWDQIPDDVNILITHGPSHGILDLVEDNAFNIGRDLHQGCEDLSNRINELKSLKLHCAGHLHSNGGQQVKIGNVIFSNGAICDEGYQPNNLPNIIDL